MLPLKPKAICKIGTFSHIPTGPALTSPTTTPQPTVQPQEVHMTSSASEIHPGFTRDLRVTCSRSHTANNNSSQFGAVTSIILSKTQTAGDKDVFQEIATVTMLARDSVDVKDSLAGAEVKGRLSVDGDSYISYQWRYPPSQAEGRYRCQVGRSVCSTQYHY